MIGLTWLRGLIAHRPARLLATALRDEAKVL